MEHEKLRSYFKNLSQTDVDFCSLRYVQNRSESLEMRQGVLGPPLLSHDEGVMITVHNRGGTGYAATSDLSERGLGRAFTNALKWADTSTEHAVIDFSFVPMPESKGSYQSKVSQRWETIPFKEKLNLLKQVSSSLKKDALIVDYLASFWQIQVQQLYIASNGTDITQDFDFLFPHLYATAHKAGESQTRTFGGYSNCRQGGYELLEDLDFIEAAKRLPEEAQQILAAPNCPTGNMSVLIDPDQMILQIHESIGHPLELDRILGDERNYAGTSFVKMDMFGKYQYGSELLNITFDPTMEHQIASYAYDDDGLIATKQYVIKDGLLLRPLGGTVSQSRAKSQGVATVRAENWNRPPIDRMANLNLEPGKSSFNEMLQKVEKGIYLKTNNSWSIDDSRNKFQFGCEWGQLIENGKLTKVVKNPNYRGVSASFWRNLSAVGNWDTFTVLGTPYCGKGEPNQVLRVGHATPACLFDKVDVFGGG